MSLFAAINPNEVLAIERTAVVTTPDETNDGHLALRENHVLKTDLIKKFLWLRTTN